MRQNKKMLHYYNGYAAAIFLCCIAANYAHAAEHINVIKTEFLVDAPRLQPGDKIPVAVRFTLPPHWHIYAKNPGDSGIPTSYAWTLPTGITAGEIQWPTPETITADGFTNYGYSDSVILPVTLTVNSAPASDSITVKASWLACEQICIPESVTLTSPIPVHDDDVAATLASTQQSGTTSSTLPFSLALGFALIGGLLLNLMPCVLPILSLKCLTLVKKAHGSRQVARAHGVAYTAGVMVSFLAIAAAMLALRASGESVGWGFQLQSPVIVFGLFFLMLAVSANLAGLFALPVLLGGVQTDHKKLRGSALTGVLAVAVATPCTAPFMAGAVGATLLLPPAQSLAIFAAMGLGMALPFLLVSFWPAALALLPKPGAWMHRFKQLLAIPMALTAVWLLLVFVQLVMPENAASSNYETVATTPYSPTRLVELRAQHTPVLLDATAAWCLTCKVNEHVALHPARTQEFLQAHHVTLMIADWTSSDADITKLLADFGRNGVPLYVFYPPSGDPVVLPQILTPQIVIDTTSSHSN